MSKRASGMLAGSDTREAATTATVRALAAAAALAAVPGFAAAFGASAAWDRWFGVGIETWPAIFLLGTALASGIGGWRQRDVTTASGRMSLENLPPGTAPLVIMGSLAVIVAGSNSARFAAAALASLPALSGWFVGRVARMATAACVPRVTPAAAGIVTAGGLLGILGARPLFAVAAGSEFVWGAVWVLVCLGVAAANLIRGHGSWTRDRKQAEAREAPIPAKSASVEVAFDCEGVEVSFGATRVLQSADLKAGRGELVALVGANGAGKSTMLRAAAGFVDCISGRVFVGGRDVTMLRPEERAAVGLAFVSGARPVFPELTVTENLRVAAFRSHTGVKSFSSATKAVFEMIPALAARRHVRAGVLSGGEQRLLAVAQTLYAIPVVLLADELTLGLALDARLAVLDLLRTLADEGVAVVAVDHDLPSLLPRADRAVLLSGGVATTFDDPAGLLDQRLALLPAAFLAEVNK